MAERTRKNKVNTLTYSERINTYNGGIKNGMLQVVGRHKTSNGWERGGRSAFSSADRRSRNCGYRIEKNESEQERNRRASQSKHESEAWPEQSGGK